MTERIRGHMTHGQEAMTGELPEGQFMLFGAWPPNDVTLPKELGGTRQEVTGEGPCLCPKCGEDHRSLHLDNNMLVIDCPTSGFLWCSK